MPISVVLGSQWGDEGKGKLVDVLCPSHLLVARCAGGNNAGHTIKHASVTYDFHLLPSGLLNPKAQNLVGSGCVVHVPGLLGELESLEQKSKAGAGGQGGLDNIRERLHISDRAHVVLDLHQKVDGLEERELEAGKGGKIGTTGKGIGPSYSTKAARSGVRIADIFNESLFEERVRRLAHGYKKRYGDLLEYDVEEELQSFKRYRQELAPMVVDQLPLLVSAQKSGTNILVEGANAIMLDIDAGTYPFVTSSNTGLGGLLTGLGGISPHNISAIYGVVKAYTTRVGSGPFPSEEHGSIGTRLQDIGGEFGVTTGRRRRCGWLDLVVVRYSTQINSYTALNLTKIDVLDTFQEIKIAVAYKDPVTGLEIDGFPADLERLEGLDVVYKSFKGWETSVRGMRQFDDLPRECRDYVLFIEEYVGVPVKYIGVGPDRDDMIIR